MKVPCAVYMAAVASFAPTLASGQSHRITWPAADPVWSLVAVSPPASSGINGSGLELRDVRYRGRLLLRQAHIPIVNVSYIPAAACDPAYLNAAQAPCGCSFRDWTNELSPFSVTPAYAGFVAATSPPQTFCDDAASEGGGFEGVAVEQTPERLIVTTQMKAAWYRYSQRWIFHPDGTLEARVGISSVDHTCHQAPHHHNVYFRLDFDIDGPGSDAVDFEFVFPPPSRRAPIWPGPPQGLPSRPSWIPPPTRTWATLQTEIHLGRRPLRVRDTRSLIGYELVPGQHDGFADAFAVADLWVLRNHPNEVDDDGGLANTLLSNMALLDDFITGESVNDADVVVWYRAGVAAGEASHACEWIGPTLRPLEAPKRWLPARVAPPGWPRPQRPVVPVL